MGRSPSDRVTLAWDLPDGNTGMLVNHYFAFVENGGDGNFWLQMQSETDGETVWDRRVRIQLEIEPHGEPKHRWQVEYAVEPWHPVAPEDDTVLEAVLGIARRHLQKRVFVDRDELERRRGFSRALAMTPQERFATPAVYRN